MDGGELEIEFQYRPTGLTPPYLWNEALIKTLDIEGWGASWLVNTVVSWVGGPHPQIPPREGTGGLCPLLAQTMPYASLQFLICILCKKTVLIHKYLVLVNSTRLSNPRDCGKSKIGSRLAEVWVNWGR